MVWGSYLVNINHYWETKFSYHISSLSTMISIRIPSKNNVWPLSLSKYIHFHSQNRCFKELTKFWRKKLPQKVRLLEGKGEGVEKLFGKNIFEQHLSFQGASLIRVIFVEYDPMTKWPFCPCAKNIQNREMAKFFEVLDTYYNTPEEEMDTFVISAHRSEHP